MQGNAAASRSLPAPAARTILVVEDDEDIRTTLETILAGEGFKVEACADGRAALSQLTVAKAPDLIILDLRMPVMDGWQFRVRQKNDPALALIPVIAISADASPQAAAVDAAAYLRKPFDYASLMNTVERVLLAFDQQRVSVRPGHIGSHSPEFRRLKNAFIGNISHEMRKPLNSLLSLTQLIRDGLAGPLTEEQRRYLEVIGRSGQTVLSQLSGIIDLADLEDGRMTVAHEELNVAHVIQSASAPLLPDIEAQRLAFEVDVPPRLPRAVADQFRLSQVVRYLLDNAVKFTMQGSIKVTADASADEATVSIHVFDTGTGIPEEKLEMLFDGFYQLDHIGDRPRQGAGLGLTLVDRLVRLMNGKVRVQSKLGTGSHFTVTLPASPVVLDSARDKT